MTVKLTPVQKKLLESIENGEKLAEINKDRQPFDIQCINDDCTRTSEGNRQIATAWKTSKGEFLVFCMCCGQDEKLDKQEFKKKKEKLDKEKALANMSKSKKSPPKKRKVGYENIEDYEFEDVSGF